MKHLFVAMICLGISFNVFSQVEIKVKGADAGVLCATQYSDLKQRSAVRHEHAGDGVMTIDNLAEETLVVVGCDDEVYFLWVSPNEKYEIDPKAGKMSGGDEKINKFLASWKEDFVWGKNVIMQNHFIQIALRRNYAEHDKEKYIKDDYVDNLKADVETQIKSLQKAKLKNEDFEKYFENFVKSNYNYTLIKTPNLISHFEKGEVPEKLLKEIAAIDVEHTDFINHRYKDDLIDGYVRAYESMGAIDPTLSDYIYQKGNLFKGEELREYYVLKELAKLVKRKETMYIDEIFESARGLMTSEQGKAEFEKLYKRRAANKDGNKKAFAMKVYDLDGKTVTLDDFKGKYVYIDMWATWCGPCKQTTPHFIEMAEKYKDKDIVFISLSVDTKSAEKQWRKYVADHFAGTNCVTVWTANGFNDPFVEHYKVNAIPRFILVKPDGQVYSDKFWSPMDPRVETLFDKMLK